MTMIAGKTHAEILSMAYSTRSRWYKTISLREREIVMDIVEAVRSAKMSGENNPTKQPEIKTKMRMAWTPERRDKQSAAMTGENSHMYGKRGKNNPNFGNSHSEETRAKISASMSGKMVGENNPNFGKIHTVEIRKKISTALKDKHVGEDNPNWRGGASFKPYCFLFNYAKKEEIRNRDERRCQLCGKSEILEGRRLSVHHIDGNKMQGCDGKRWGLVALCRSCNSRADTLEKEFLIVSNLNLANGVEISI